jgi:hypothetical protein
MSKYADLVELYNKVKNTPSFKGMSIEEFQQDVDRLYASIGEAPRFGEAANPDNFKAFSKTLTDLVKDSWLESGTGAVGSVLGRPFNLQEAGERGGKSAARGFVNMVPMIGASLASGPAAPIVGGAGLFGTAGLFGSQAYEETGDIGEGLKSAAIALAVPKVIGKIGESVTGGLQSMSPATRGLGSSMLQRTAGEAAGQVGGGALFEGIHQIENYQKTGEFDVSPDNFFERQVSNAVYLPLSAPTILRKTSYDRMKQIEKTEGKDAAQKYASVERELTARQKQAEVDAAIEKKKTTEQARLNKGAQPAATPTTTPSAAEVPFDAPPGVKPKQKVRQKKTTPADEQSKATDALFDDDTVTLQPKTASDTEASPFSQKTVESVKEELAPSGANQIPIENVPKPTMIGGDVVKNSPPEETVPQLQGTVTTGEVKAGIREVVKELEKGTVAEQTQPELTGVAAPETNVGKSAIYIETGEKLTVIGPTANVPDYFDVKTEGGELVSISADEFRFETKEEAKATNEVRNEAVKKAISGVPENPFYKAGTSVWVYPNRNRVGAFTATVLGVEGPDSKMLKVQDKQGNTLVVPQDSLAWISHPSRTITGKDKLKLAQNTFLSFSDGAKKNWVAQTMGDKMFESFARNLMEKNSNITVDEIVDKLALFIADRLIFEANKLEMSVDDFNIMLESMDTFKVEGMRANTEPVFQRWLAANEGKLTHAFQELQRIDSAYGAEVLRKRNNNEYSTVEEYRKALSEYPSKVLASLQRELTQTEQGAREIAAESGRTEQVIYKLLAQYSNNIGRLLAMDRAELKNTLRSSMSKASVDAIRKESVLISSKKKQTEDQVEEIRDKYESDENADSGYYVKSVPNNNGTFDVYVYQRSSLSRDAAVAESEEYTGVESEEAVFEQMAETGNQIAAMQEIHRTLVRMETEDFKSAQTMGDYWAQKLSDLKESIFLTLQNLPNSRERDMQAVRAMAVLDFFTDRQFSLDLSPTSEKLVGYYNAAILSWVKKMITSSEIKIWKLQRGLEGEAAERSPEFRKFLLDNEENFADRAAKKAQEFMYDPQKQGDDVEEAVRYLMKKLIFGQTVKTATGSELRTGVLTSDEKIRRFIQTVIPRAAVRLGFLTEGGAAYIKELRLKNASPTAEDWLWLDPFSAGAKRTAAILAAKRDAAESRSQKAQIAQDKMTVEGVPDISAPLPGLRFAEVMQVLDSARDSTSFVKSTLSLFRQLFAKEGQGPAAKMMAERTDFMTRVASVFKSADDTVVSKTDSDQFFGAMMGRKQATNGALPTILMLNVNKLKTINRSARTMLHSTVLGHEAFEVVYHKYKNGMLSQVETEAMTQLLAGFAALTPADRAQYMRQVANELVVKSDVSKNFESQADFQKILENIIESTATSPKETAATIAGFYAIAASSKRAAEVMKDAADGLDTHVTKVGLSVVENMSDMADIVKSAVSNPFLAEVFKPTEGQNTINPFYGEIAGLYQKFSRTAAEIDAHISQLDHLRSMNIDEFVRDKSLHILDKVPKQFIEFGFADLALEGIKVLAPSQRTIHPVNEWLEGMVTLTEAHPKLKPILSESLKFQARVEEAAETLIAPFMTKTPTGLMQKHMDSVNFVMRDKKLSDWFSKWTRDEQLKDRLWTATEQVAAFTKAGFSPEIIQHLQTLRKQISDSSVQGAKLLKNYTQELATHVLAQSFMRYDPAMGYEAALTDAALAVRCKLVTKHGLVDPTMQPPDALVAWAGLENKFRGTTVEAILTPSTENLVEPVANLHAHLRGREHFITEMRYGKYQVTYKKRNSTTGQEETGRESASNEADLQVLFDQITKDPNYVVDSWNADVFEPGTLPGFSQKVADLYEKVEDRAYNTALTHIPAPSADIMRTQYQPMDAARQEMFKRGLQKYTQPRSFSLGRENLNMIDQHIQYMMSMPSALGKNWMRHRSNTVLMDPVFMQDAQLAELGRSKFETMMVSSGPVENAVRAGTVFWYLGANLSSMTVEFFQGLQNIPATLARYGGDVGESFGITLNAYKEVLQEYFTGKFTDPFYQQYISELQSRRILDRGIVSQFVDSSMINIFREQIKQKNYKGLQGVASKFVVSPLIFAAGKSRDMYAVATAASTRMSAIAGLAYAKKLVTAGKLAPEKVADFVQDIVLQASPGTGGKAVQPIKMHSGKVLPRGVTSVLATLQNFTMQMTYMMCRRAQAAVRSGSWTSAESKSAMILWGTQLVAAGLMGLPGAGSAIGLIKQFLPGLEIEKNIKTFIANLAGEDAALGHTLSNTFIHGIVNQLTGLDISSRVGLGNMFGVSGFDGVSISSLLSAPGGILEGTLRAKEKIDKGYIAEGVIDMLPIALRNIVKMAYNRGATYDSAGNLMHQAKGMENFAQAIGFTPASLALSREQNRMHGITEQVSAARLNETVSAATRKYATGQIAEARQIINDYLVKNPGVSPESVVNSVARRVVKRENERQPSAGASARTAKSRGEIARAFNSVGGKGTYFEQAKETVKVAKDLGVNTKDPGAKFKAAVMKDFMTSKFPKKSAAEIEDMVRKMK